MASLSSDELEIVVAAYGPSPYLSLTLDSTAAAMPADIRITVLDDASPDDAVERIAAAHAGRVAYRRNDQNLGTSGSFNAAMRISRARYTLLVGPDDLLLPGAADAYAAALQARRMAFGDADWRTQEVRLRQVSLLSLRQRHREALPLAQAVVDAVRRVTADADPHLADALNALAMVQTNLGQLESAEALRREELALVQRLYGASHPRTVSAENDLASVLYAQFRFEEAAALFDRVLAARRAKYGSDSPHVALVANNLAWCELDLGHGARARELAAEALQIRRAQYGDAHHGTAASLRALGASELALGQLGEAGTHLRDAVASYEAALGPTSRSLLPVLDDLVRWELLAGAPAPRCATAQRAAQLYGLKADDASQAAAYQRVVLHACLVASDDAQADPAQLQAALDAVKRLSHPRSSTIGKAVLLADAAGRLSDRRSKAVRAR